MHLLSRDRAGVTFPDKIGYILMQSLLYLIMF